MEVQTNGRRSAQRCYDEIAKTGDVETGQALWRAFGRYYRKDRPARLRAASADWVGWEEQG